MRAWHKQPSRSKKWAQAMIETKAKAREEFERFHDYMKDTQARQKEV